MDTTTSTPPKSSSLNSEKCQIEDSQIDNAVLTSSKLDSPEIDPATIDFSHIDEAATLRKMDLRLIPTLAILYLLSFLDRGYVLIHFKLILVSSVYYPLHHHQVLKIASPKLSEYRGHAK
jgi:hypothetical protein